METEINALTELLRAIAVYPLVGLDVWFSWMLVRSFRRDERFIPMTMKEYFYGTFAGRSYFILCLCLTGALIYQHIWR